MPRASLPRLPLALTLAVLGCPADDAVTPETMTMGSEGGALTSSTSESATHGSAPATGSTNGPPDDTVTDGPGPSDTTTTAGSTSDPDITGESDTTGVPDATTGVPDSTGTADTTTGMPDSTGTADTTTGMPDSTGTADTTTGLPGTTSGDTTTGVSDTTTGDSDTTGGEQDDPWCCEPGCGIPLMQSQYGLVAVEHSGTRIVTLDAARRLGLWRADTLGQLLDTVDVDAAVLQGDTLVYRRGDQLHIVDAKTAAELATCPADTQWGVAQDGSYVWTAGAAGLDLLELDCDLRWSTPGALGDARVLATTDALHLYDADLAPQAVVHLDALGGNASEDAFLGTFASWFADVPRYWTTQGQAHRLYDIDNTLLELAAGVPEYGWGTRLLRNGFVADIFVPGNAAMYHPNSLRTSGAGVMWIDPIEKKVNLIRLDVDALANQVVQPACCVSEYNLWNFAYADGAWVVGGPNGYVTDHLARFLSDTQALFLDGSQIGRVAVGVAGGAVFVFDLAEGCKLTAHPPFQRSATAGEIYLPSDGSLLLSSERWKGPNWMDKTLSGSRIYSVPDGEKLYESQVGIMNESIVGQSISDDGGMWSRLTYTGQYTFSASHTLGPSALYNYGNVLPKLAPHSQHLAYSDGDPFDMWHTASSYIYSLAPYQLVGVTDGVVLGFIDDEHLLIGHYKLPNYTFINTTIVDLEGVIVQTSTLPDIRRFSREATGEILAEVEPDKHAVIFDPFTGDALWAAPPAARAAIVGPDHIATSDKAGVQLVKWR